MSQIIVLLDRAWSCWRGERLRARKPLRSGPSMVFGSVDAEESKASGNAILGDLSTTREVTALETDRPHDSRR